MWCIILVKSLQGINASSMLRLALLSSDWLFCPHIPGHERGCDLTCSELRNNSIDMYAPCHHSHSGVVQPRACLWFDQVRSQAFVMMDIRAIEWFTVVCVCTSMSRRVTRPQPRHHEKIEIGHNRNNRNNRGILMPTTSRLITTITATPSVTKNHNKPYQP